VVLDVGGGPGGHACWLAVRGYQVHLLDIIPLHVELARRASARQPQAPLAGAEVGDARALARGSGTADAVVLFGPLYHLTDRADRVRALQEAYRVLRPGGVLLAAAISRFASALGGLCRGFLKDPNFAEIVRRDLADGQHRNPTGRPEYFMDTFFHHPDELRAEVGAAGFGAARVYGVEGPGWLLSDFDAWWDDGACRERLMQLARAGSGAEPFGGERSPHGRGHEIGCRGSSAEGVDHIGERWHSSHRPRCCSPQRAGDLVLRA
jgi:SAM-dependent methyltransferase